MRPRTTALSESLQSIRFFENAVPEIQAASRAVFETVF
jgi:hypothetical protein